MLEHEDTADAHTTALDWLHARLRHSFTVFANNFEYTDAVLRGREPWAHIEDDPDGYVIDVYVRVAALHVGRDRLADAELLEDGDAIRLTFREGQEVEIVDEG